MAESIVPKKSTAEHGSAWIEIHLSALQRNLEAVKNAAAPDARVLAVIKAAGYGHGLIDIARALEDRVSYLGISSIQEAAQMREEKVRTPLFLFGALLDEEIPSALQDGLTLSVSSLREAQAISEKSVQAGRVTPLHVKVDTGMGRLGIPFRKAVAEITQMAALAAIRLEGIYTHFPTAESDDGFRDRQVYDFSLLIRALEEKEIRFVFRHCSNSAGALKVKDMTFNLIRPGLLLFGAYPDECLRDGITVSPVLSLKSRAISVKRILPDQTVGYGRAFKAREPVTIMTLPVGYSHGYPFRAAEKGEVLLRGKRYPVAGRVSMDYLCVNLGNDYAEIGEEVTLLGRDGEDEITAEEMAGWAGTIPYEILTGLSERLPRIYVEKGA